MEQGKIYEAISNVMDEVGAVKKNKKNTQQGFMFRGIDDVMNALYPAMSKHKVFVTPEVLEQVREERKTAKGSTLIYSICKIKYTFYTTDGSSVSATVIGEGMDSGDKATNKAMAIAFKYACFQTFCIPTEEMIDPDQEVPPPSDKTTRADMKNESKKDDGEKTPENTLVSAAMVSTLNKELSRTGVDKDTVLKMCKIDKLEAMNIAQFKKMMAKFHVTPDRKGE